MRGDDDIGQVEQRTVRRRLCREDIEGRARDAARFQRVGQSGFVDEAAPGAVDQSRARFQLCDCAGGKEVAGLLGYRNVQRHEIGPLEQRVEFDLFHPKLGCPVFGQEGIVGDDLHLETQGPVDHDRTDIARADNAKGLGRQFDTHEAGLFPLSRMGRGIGFGDLPGHGHHHRDRVLGRRDRVPERGVHDDNATFRRGGDVDIVDADPGAADHLEVRGCGKHLVRNLGRGPDGKTVIVGDRGKQTILVLTQGRVESDIDAAVTKDLHGGIREFVGDKNFGGHWWRSCGLGQKAPC